MGGSPQNDLTPSSSRPYRVPQSPDSSSRLYGDGEPQSHDSTKYILGVPNKHLSIIDMTMTE